MTDATDISTLETLKCPLHSKSAGFQKRSNVINIITGENLFEIDKFDRLLQAQIINHYKLAGVDPLHMGSQNDQMAPQNLPMLAKVDSDVSA